MDCSLRQKKIHILFLGVSSHPFNSFSSCCHFKMGEKTLNYYRGGWNFACDITFSLDVFYLLFNSLCLCPVLQRPMVILAFQTNSQLFFPVRICWALGIKCNEESRDAPAPTCDCSPEQTLVVALLEAVGEISFWCFRGGTWVGEEQNPPGPEENCCFFIHGKYAQTPRTKQRLRSIYWSVFHFRPGSN